MTLKFKSKDMIVFLISILAITNIAILLNIPFLRQVLGFLFLTILPGLLILHVLKLTKLDFLERFILSWGLSISFLMLFGLFMDNLYFSLGYATPLSTISLVVTFNAVIIILCVVGYKTKTFEKSFIKPDFSEKEIVNPSITSRSKSDNGLIQLTNYLPKFNLTASEKAVLIVPILFPALSVFGMHVMNTTDNNIILMFMLFLIPIYVAFVCFFNQKYPKRLYPVVIFLISISLLLLLSLRSNHLIGSDVHTEYRIFLTTFDNLHWTILGYSVLDACLSISLLPTIYQSILNVHTEYLYKILPSLLCSVFPLIIYVISKKYIGEFYAFLASMFFMSNTTFLWTEYNARASIAMLFFAFAMMTLFSDRIEPLKKRILFIVFMASCVVSHYTTTYVFFFVMLLTFAGIEIVSKKYTFKKDISLTIVLMFFAMLFFWYSQATGAPFDSGVGFIEKTFSSLGQFAVIESRRDSAQLLLGKGELLQESIVYMIHWLLTWLTFVFIGIGVIALILRRKEMSFPEPKFNFKKPDFLKAKFEVGYFVISLACVCLLVTIIAVPFVSQGYGVGRAYPLASTILSIFFVIGGIMIAKTLSFLKQTFKKHFFFSQKTLLLRKSLYGKNASHETGAKRKLWFFGKAFLPKERSDGKNGSQIWAYLMILLVLIPYFMCVTGTMYQIFGVPEAITLNSEGRVYDMYYIHDHYIMAKEWLSSSEVVKSKLVNKQKTIGNMTEYLGLFNQRNRIYDNGGSEIWK